MFIRHEKRLIEKNYIENNESNNILSFFHKDDSQSHVTVSKNDNRFKVSFPMSNKKVQYATYFQDKEKAKEYLSYIIDSHL